jgi:hypothetical protein
LNPADLRLVSHTTSDSVTTPPTMRVAAAFTELSQGGMTRASPESTMSVDTTTQRHPTSGRRPGRGGMDLIP